MIDTLQYTVSSLIESVCNNGITNTNASVNGNTYCSAKATSLANKYTELQSIATVYETQLKNLGNVISGSTSETNSSSSSNLYSLDIETYVELIDKLVEVETEMASVQTQISEVGTLQGNLTDLTDATNAAVNAAYMTSTESTIETVVNAVYYIIDEYNDLVTEFEDSVMPSAYATVSKPAAVYQDSIISWSLLIIVVVAVAVVAYVVAFGQTWSALKKAGTLNGEPEKRETI
ncbi:MAG: hypothetical protein LUI60_01805 [Clostridia bacterium]|nr:hypothetical protein [Clostridia bacterium]